MRQIDEIIIHCSATRAGEDWHASDIKRWHKDRGFATIGYHFVIDLDGLVEIGRPIAQMGAHCIGHNKTTIGVCYIGGLNAAGEPTDTRTNAQRVSLHNLLTHLVAQYHCPISGHRDYANKDCPCFDAKSEFADIYANFLRRQRAELDEVLG